MVVDVPNDGIGWLRKRLSAPHALDRASIEALDALPFTLKTYEHGQYLLREGDRPKICQFLLGGFLYRHKIVGDGGRQIVAIHLPGDLIDVQQILLKEADHNVQALTAATVLVVAAEELIAAARAHSSIAVALWHQMLIEASIAREWIANIGRRSARARTAHRASALRTGAAQRTGRARRARSVRVADDAGAARRRARTDRGTCQPHAQDARE